eukprot:scaffold496502_cov22-Prasinocladus_malaysianus.AAC.1
MSSLVTIANSFCWTGLMRQVFGRIRNSLVAFIRRGAAQAIQKSPIIRPRLSVNSYTWGNGRIRPTAAVQERTPVVRRCLKNHRAYLNSYLMSE